MTENEQQTPPSDVTAAELNTAPDDPTQPALERITAAAAAAAAVADLPLAEHAERYQKLHATLQTELGAIAQL